MATDDSYTKALLHFTGADGSTTITDMSGKTWTARGTAQVDTAQYKFGGASLLLDGNSDWVDTPDSADFNISSGDWTIDCWIRLAALDAEGYICWQDETAGDDYFNFQITAAGALACYYNNGSANLIAVASATGQFSLNTWYHVAVTHNDSTDDTAVWIGGVKKAQTVDTGAPANLTSVFRVGSNGTNRYINGWIDEFRFSKGICRWTDTFTPPTIEYQTPARMARGLIIG